MLCPIAVIVREYERQGHENKGQQEMAKKTKTLVRETISHGEFHKDRFLYVDLKDVSSVLRLLNSCSYLLLPEADFADGAAMVSSSYEEIVARRLEDAKRVSSELLEANESHVGWVTFEIVGERERQACEWLIAADLVPTI